MTIELTPETHCLGLWFVNVPEASFNVLAAVTRQPGEPYTGWVRFRYIQDARIVNSSDRKSGYTLEGRTAEREEGMRIRRDLAKALRLLHASAGGEYHFLPLDCDGDEAAKRLLAQPWAHVLGIQ